MKDLQGKMWTMGSELAVCEDGRQIAIVPEMTAEYVLSVINKLYQPQVPDAVDMAPARLALLEAGLLTFVEQALNALPEPERSAAKIEWEFRPRVRRDSNLVLQLAGALGLTSDQLDQLFIRAKELE